MLASAYRASSLTSASCCFIEKKKLTSLKFIKKKTSDLSVLMHAMPPPASICVLFISVFWDTNEHYNMVSGTRNFLFYF